MSDGTRPRDGQPPAIPAPGPPQPGGHHPDGPGSAAAGPSQPAPSGRATSATVAAYAAAAAALSNALVSAYWALSGRGLISTVGGYVTQFAHQKGAAPVLLALGAAAAKAAGGLLALALVRLWGRVIPRGWLLAGSAGASALLLVYGGLNVLLAALVLSEHHPPGRKRGPGGIVVAHRGLGPVVPGVGDLAGAGHRRLLAPDGNGTSA